MRNGSKKCVIKPAYNEVTPLSAAVKAINR